MRDVTRVDDRYLRGPIANASRVTALRAASEVDATEAIDNRLFAWNRKVGWHEVV